MCWDVSGSCVHPAPHTSFVFTQRVIWLMFKGVMLAESSPICTMAFTRRKVAWTSCRLQTPIYFWPHPIKTAKEGWKGSWQIMASLHHLILAFLMVATASFTSATNLGSSKMPQGTWKNRPESSDPQLFDFAVPGSDHHGGARPSGGWTPFFQPHARNSSTKQWNTHKKTPKKCARYTGCPHLRLHTIRKWKVSILTCAHYWVLLNVVVREGASILTDQLKDSQLLSSYSRVWLCRPLGWARKPSKEQLSLLPSMQVLKKWPGNLPTPFGNNIDNQHSIWQLH